MKLKIGMPNILKGDKDALVKEGYVTIESDTYKLTPKAKTFIVLNVLNRGLSVYF